MPRCNIIAILEFLNDVICAQTGINDTLYHVDIYMQGTKVQVCKLC